MITKIRNGLRKLFQRLIRIRRDEVAGKTLAELILGIIVHGIIFFVLGMIFVKGRLFYGIGLLAGIIVAVYAAINMYDTLDRGLSLKDKDAVIYIRRKSFGRTAAALGIMTIAVIIDFYAFVGVTIGLISLKTSSIFNKYLVRFLEKD